MISTSVFIDDTACSRLTRYSRVEAWVIANNWQFVQDAILDRQSMELLTGGSVF